MYIYNVDHPPTRLYGSIALPFYVKFIFMFIHEHKILNDLFCSMWNGLRLKLHFLDKHYSYNKCITEKLKDIRTILAIKTSDRLCQLNLQCGSLHKTSFEIYNDDLWVPAEWRYCTQCVILFLNNVDGSLESTK